MPAWCAAVGAAVSLAGGVMAVRAGRKANRGWLRCAGAALLALCAACLVYLAAALALLNGLR